MEAKEKRDTEKVLSLFKQLDLGIDSVDIVDNEALEDIATEESLRRSLGRHAQTPALAEPTLSKSCFALPTRPPTERNVLQFTSFKNPDDSLLSPKGRFRRKGNDEWRLIAPGSLKELTSLNSHLSLPMPSQDLGDTPSEKEALGQGGKAPSDNVTAQNGIQRALNKLTVPARKISAYRNSRSQVNNENQGSSSLTSAAAHDSNPRMSVDDRSLESREPKDKSGIKASVKHKSSPKASGNMLTQTEARSPPKRKISVKRLSGKISLSPKTEDALPADTENRVLPKRKISVTKLSGKISSSPKAKDVLPADAENRVLPKRKIFVQRVSGKVSQSPKPSENVVSANIETQSLPKRKISVKRSGGKISGPDGEKELPKRKVSIRKMLGH